MRIGRVLPGRRRALLCDNATTQVLHQVHGAVGQVSVVAARGQQQGQHGHAGITRMAMFMAGTVGMFRAGRLVWAMRLGAGLGHGRARAPW